VVSLLKLCCKEADTHPLTPCICPKNEKEERKKRKDLQTTSEKKNKKGRRVGKMGRPRK
jgi:hypothetical protein